MQLSELRAAARTRYGLAGSASDATFTDAVMNDLVNEAHRWLAERCLLYRQRQSYTLPAAVSGRSSVPLDCNVICLVPDSRVRVLVGGSWRYCDWRDEQEIARLYGPEKNLSGGAPRWFYLRPGDALDAMLVLDLVPGWSGADVPNGVDVDVYIYPSLLSADADTPAFQPAQHMYLVPVICREMAALERDLGRPDAPVEYWAARAEAAALDLRRVIARARRVGGRRVRPSYV